MPVALDEHPVGAGDGDLFIVGGLGDGGGVELGAFGSSLFPVGYLA
jgi:hypothetical protein